MAFIPISSKLRQSNSPSVITQKGLEFVRNNDSETIAKSIYDFFPDMSLNDLITSIENYKSQDTWNQTTFLSEDSFNHLQEIMIAAGELEDKVPYYDLVDNTYSD